jgi:hypothetical protein
MLVPAFAFAWWLVSLPTPPWSAASSGDVARLQALRETRLQASEPAVDRPLDGEWSGERVPVKVVTPAIVKVAQSFLDLPMGDERFVAIGGHRYVFVLERHYHPPGFVGAPNGWHKGVTAYELR